MMMAMLLLPLLLLMSIFIIIVIIVGGAARIELAKEILQIVHALIRRVNAIRIPLEDLQVLRIDLVEVSKIEGMLIAAKCVWHVLHGSAAVLHQRQLLVLRERARLRLAAIARVLTHVSIQLSALITLHPNAVDVRTGAAAEILDLKERIAHKAGLVVQFG